MTILLDMRMSKSKKIAYLSVSNSLLRLLAGPLTLIILSLKLSSEELGIYFAFFGVIGLKALFEAGISNALRVTFSHQKLSDIESLSNLFLFALIWHLILGVILTVSLIIIGAFVFSGLDVSVDLTKPWVAVSISTSILIIISFVEPYLDGCQKQIELKYLQIASSCSVFGLWFGLYNGFGLYSIFFMQLANIIIVLAILFLYKHTLFSFKFNFSTFNFKAVFLQIWPLLKRVIAVWFVGYFFWNITSLTSIRLFSAEIAGYIGMSFALGKAGYSIAGSILTNQMTLIAKKIHNGKELDARIIFYKYLLGSLFIMLVGFSIFIFLKNIYGYTEFMSKTLPTIDLLLVFIMFVCIHLYVSFNNYVRAFKIEPFFYFSLGNALTFSISFIFGNKVIDFYFFFPMISCFIFLTISTVYFKYFINSKQN